MDTPYARLTALAARQHGHLTRAQAAGHGLHKSAVRNLVAQGRLVPITTEVLQVAGAPDGPLPRVAAAVLDGGPGAVVSHTSAAWLLGLPGFEAMPVHVTRPIERNHHRSPVAVIHHSTALPPHHVQRVSDLPLTSPARTLLDLGAVVHPKRQERAVDTALSRGMVTPAHLVRLLDEIGGRGRRGTRALRAALDGRAPGTESELEARFRDLLRRHGLPQPERQVVLGSAGERAGRVDCLFRAARLVVELDGRPYHSSKLDRLEDGRRDLVLLRGGLRVLRLTWHHVVEREAEVAAALQELLSCAA
ncbi:MAG TPA: type IV toxin-antitoxin system AbiEi family antitoxin domain-containing protein [Acidimicrobiales bacterium]|nr:type IV toxin-antitoxin system AbiEi family antitoxin domain-containing protein [Acidimicrobiales bacterium]